jgi:hypothetical protein
MTVAARRQFPTAAGAHPRDVGIFLDGALQCLLWRAA